ncbi:Dihydrolipoyllysine-residue succinyltransferase component of 2-oxoglutarate dehydrogenase complex [bioreactor metagenome]|uniref:Dihydrolipoyllysine-residue succinyltransferase component of 2-oxoglutarate dehydrogenase complex n=1 Tax=bioreactor metagenome TaxID=1076179 RepID=A0A645JC11_9ZZZZ
MAVAVEGGLVVPNVKAVQAKSLLQIASETDDMVARTRENQLELEEMQGGTFTISNLGMFGMHSFTPIVNPPEACILAVNAIVDRPMVIDGEIQVRPISMLCLTADHRLVDGADAAKFLVRVKELIENPYLLLL